MPIDKFGNTVSTVSSTKKSRINFDKMMQQHQLITLTIDGDYDVQNHKLSNVQTPTKSNDCANKQYVDNIDGNIKKKINEIVNIVQSMIDKKIKDGTDVLNKQLTTEINNLKSLTEKEFTRTSATFDTFVKATDDEKKNLQTKIDTLLKSSEQNMHVKMVSIVNNIIDSLNKEIAKNSVETQKKYTEKITVLNKKYDALKNDVNNSIKTIDEKWIKLFVQNEEKTNKLTKQVDNE